MADTKCLILTCTMSVAFPAHAVQHGERQVVWRVGVQRRPPPSPSAAGLGDQARLGALLVAGQGRTADVSSSSTAGAVGRAGRRAQAGPCARGPRWGVFTVRAEWGQRSNRAEFRVDVMSYTQYVKVKSLHVIPPLFTFIRTLTKWKTNQPIRPEDSQWTCSIYIERYMLYISIYI